MSEVNNINIPLYHNGHLRSEGRKYVNLELDIREYAYDALLGRVIEDIRNLDTSLDDVQVTPQKPTKNIDTLLTVTH